MKQQQSSIQLRESHYNERALALPVSILTTSFGNNFLWDTTLPSTLSGKSEWE